MLAAQDGADEGEGVAALLSAGAQHRHQDGLGVGARRVRLPPQTLRLTTARRIACWAR